MFHEAVLSLILHSIRKDGSFFASRLISTVLESYDPLLLVEGLLKSSLLNHVSRLLLCGSAAERLFDLP